LSPARAVTGALAFGARKPVVPPTAILKLFVAVDAGLAESVTGAVKLKVPLAVGVPLMAPVVVFRVRPGGNPPLAMDQL
jgi:hypothetical protein